MVAIFKPRLGLKIEILLMTEADSLSLARGDDTIAACCRIPHRGITFKRFDESQRIGRIYA